MACFLMLFFISLQKSIKKYGKINYSLWRYTYQEFPKIK